MDALNLDALQLVVLALADELYGVEIAAIQEIITMQAITPIPRSPDAIEGVINLRGRVVPVIDLRRQLGFALRPSTRSTRIVVAKLNGHVVGLVVDAVSRVLTAPRSRIEPLSPMVAGVNTDYLRGIVKVDGQMIVWIDLARALLAGPPDPVARTPGDPPAGPGVEPAHA